MSHFKGCLRGTLLGCGGLIVVGIVVAGVGAILAHRAVERQEIADTELNAPSMTAMPAVADAPVRAGRVILDLHQGEFHIRPAKPGEGLHVEARFDQNSYVIQDSYEVLPDSTWVYRVHYRRTTSGLQALLVALMDHGTDSRVDVFLPVDVPIALEVNCEEGGTEAQFGGLWLTEIDLRYRKGGFDLGIDDPLREPTTLLRMNGAMGGFSGNHLGNASPAVLDIDCAMGGADIDLRGSWLNDCAARLNVKMGGMSVRLPRDADVEGTADGGDTLRLANPEITLPVLRFSTSAHMGNIDFSGR